MSTIQVKCIDQTMALMSTPVITSGGIQEDLVAFDFCPMWDGYSRTAVFWRTANDPHYRVLGEENTCIIPDEVLLAEGSFYFGVFGVNAEGVQRTTGVLKYNVEPGVLRADTKPMEPTPDIYVQMLAGYANAEAAAIEAARAATETQQALASAETALENAEKVFQDAVADVDGLVDSRVQVALPNFLDDTLTAPDKAAPAAAVAAALLEKAVITSGSYVGTGDLSIAPCLNFGFDLVAVEIFELVTDKYNQGDDTSYTAPVAFESKLRLVKPFAYANVYKHNASGSNASGLLTYDAGLRVAVNWDGGYVEWYTEEYKPDNGGDEPDYDTWLDMQANVAGKTYYYIAIGKEAANG